MLCVQRKIIFRSWNQAVCPGYVKGFFLRRVCSKSRGAGELLGEGKDCKLTLGCGSERTKGWKRLCCAVAPGDSVWRHKKVPAVPRGFVTLVLYCVTIRPNILERGLDCLF